MEPKWLHFTYSLLGLLSNFFEERVPLGQKMKLKKKEEDFWKAVLSRAWQVPMEGLGGGWGEGIRTGL